MYKEKLIESFRNLQLLLFIPDLIMLIFSFLLGFFFVRQSGILNFLTANQLSSSLETLLETLIPVLSEFIQNNLLVIIIYLLLFFIGGFVIGSGLLAMKFGMMRDVVEKRKLSFRKMYDYSLYYFWDVVFLRLAVFLIALIAITIFGILVSLNALNPYYKQVFFILIALLFLLTLIFLRFLLLFRYPALFFDRKNSIQTIKNLYNYLLKNFKHVVITWIIVFVVGLVVILLDISLSRVNIINLLILIIVIRYIVNLVYGVWNNLFLFYMYKLK